MNYYLIPLINSPQNFGLTLNGVNYSMTLYWNSQSYGGWTFDLSNADTEESLLAGVPLTTGLNLLDGLDYLGIGGEFWVYTNGDPDAVPTYENLGVDSNLYFVTDGSVNG